MADKGCDKCIEHEGTIDDETMDDDIEYEGAIDEVRYGTVPADEAIAMFVAVGVVSADSISFFTAVNEELVDEMVTRLVVKFPVLGSIFRSISDSALITGLSVVGSIPGFIGDAMSAAVTPGGRGVAHPSDTSEDSPIVGDEEASVEMGLDIAEDSC